MMLVHLRVSFGHSDFFLFCKKRISKIVSFFFFCKDLRFFGDKALCCEESPSFLDICTIKYETFWFLRCNPFQCLCIFISKMCNSCSKLKYN